MAGHAVGRIALLSIRPPYANAIVEGRKTVEYRRRPLAPDVTHAVIYATLPLGRVVGLCEIADQTVDSPQAIWAKTAHRGAIAQERFDEYFAGRARAVAIDIRFVDPLAAQQIDLAWLGAVRPPQSFQYLESRVVRRLATEMGELLAV